MKHGIWESTCLAVSTPQLLQLSLLHDYKSHCMQGPAQASTHSTLGSLRMARAIAMRCFCPPDIRTPFSPTCVLYLRVHAARPLNTEMDIQCTALPHDPASINAGQEIFQQLFVRYFSPHRQRRDECMGICRLGCCNNLLHGGPCNVACASVRHAVLCANASPWYTNKGIGSFTVEIAREHAGHPSKSLSTRQEALKRHCAVPSVLLFRAAPTCLACQKQCWRQ